MMRRSASSQLMAGVLLAFHWLPPVELPVAGAVTLPVPLLLPLPLAAPVPVALPVVEAVLRAGAGCRGRRNVRGLLPVPVQTRIRYAWSRRSRFRCRRALPYFRAGARPGSRAGARANVVRVSAAVTVVEAVLLVWPSLAGACRLGSVDLSRSGRRCWCRALR